MDLHTLHVEHAVLLALYTLLTFLNLRVHRGAPGLAWFPAFAVSVCGGAALVALRGTIPDWLSIVCGNALFSLGYLFLHRSMTSFFGRGAYGWRFQIALVSAFILAMIEYGAVHPNTSRRLIALSIVLTVQLTITGWLVFRSTPPYMRSAGWIMGIVLFLLAAGNLIRLAGVVLQGAPGNYLRGGPLLAWVVINTSVLQGGIIVSFVWMTAARLHHDLVQQATTDPLTSLYNRRALETIAERTIAAKGKNHTPISAILFDLDNFKEINDSFGHLGGDAALIAVSRCLQRETRPGDTLARWAGDEFAILLDATELEAAQALAERLRMALEQLCVRYGSHEFSLTASFGVAELSSAAGGWDELMQQCDRALYAVKSSGGNFVHCTS
ncbi:sensor domain-containing diguanylate cyclase [Silvibacterium dinghuense]|nr:GGDEF domain-containing protein [Silvibacterium dinghuense]GGG92315.1 GGDEF domain-containing protein [Silvibacterium dinghuense]